MKTAAEFRTYFEAEIRPLLVELDGERNRVAGRLVIAVLVTLVCVVALFAIGSAFENSRSFPWPGVAGALALFYIVYYTATSAAKKRRHFIGEFKRIVVERIVKFVDPGLRYSPGQMVAPSVYAESGLFRKKWDRYEGDDHVEGTVGRTPIQFSEVRTRYKTVQQDGDNRRERWHPIFWGLFFRCEFNKTFRGRTYVFPDKAERLLGRFGAFLQGLDKAHGTLMPMEDVEFEKRFAVYGDDPVEARYVLSTSLMERLTRFHDKARLATCLAFVNSELFVAIEYGRALFEPRIFRTLVDYPSCQAYFDDIQLVAWIVEDLNLNTRIWGEKAMADLPGGGEAGAGAGVAQAGGVPDGP